MVTFGLSCTSVLHLLHLFILNDTFQLEQLRLKTSGQFSTSLVLSLLFISLFIISDTSVQTTPVLI